MQGEEVMLRLSMTNKMVNGLLVLFMTTQVWSEQAALETANSQTRIKSSGETYVINKNDAKASNLPAGAEQFPILETDGLGEAKADVNKVVLERTFNTPKVLRVKLKTPLFKYKPIMSGTDFYVETFKEIQDPRTSQIVRVKDYQKKRLVWCGLEPCLMRSNFLLKACIKDSKSCSSAYETIVIDFSKAQKLELGETEQFLITSYQRKIPGDAIDFLVYPIPGRILPPRYIVNHKNRLFRKDKFIVRLPTQKEIDIENKKNNVVPQDVIDLESAVELNKNTRYTTLPTNMGLPGEPANPNGNGSTNPNGQGQLVEEICLDGMGSIESRRMIEERRGNTPVTPVGREVERKTEQSVKSIACVARRNTMVLQESLAGLKGKIDRTEFLKKNTPALVQANDASLVDDLEVEND